MASEYSPVWARSTLNIVLQQMPAGASMLCWHGVGSTRIVTMHLLCAWCRREGKPGYLGMREPLENPAPTHGVCGIHKERLLESFPSRSFTDVELLIVVRRNGTLYERLQGSFAGVRRVKVIVERRVGDRRSMRRPVTEERRHVRTQRRIRRGTTSPLGGFTIVRFTPKEIIPPLPSVISLGPWPEPVS